MRALGYLVTVLAALLLAGCVASLHPLYDDTTLVADDALLGAWKSEDGDAHFLFTKDAAPPFYRLVYVAAKAPPVQFRAALARIGGRLYLDVIPLAPDSLDRNGFLSLHVLLWHSFAQVEVAGQALRLRLPDPRWLDAYLQAHPGALPHFRDQGELYLTADTQALQAFVTAHAALFDRTPRLFTRE